MAHKYLDDIGVTKDKNLWWFDDNQYPDDNRIKKWEKEREIYGFDDRETWDLQTTFYLWLYERLMKYVDSASSVVNLSYHTFEYQGEKYTQIELINIILEKLRFFFSPEFEDFNEDHINQAREIGYLWAIVLPAMWW